MFISFNTFCCWSLCCSMPFDSSWFTLSRLHSDLGAEDSPSVKLLTEAVLEQTSIGWRPLYSCSNSSCAFRDWIWLPHNISDASKDGYPHNLNSIRATLGLSLRRAQMWWFRISDHLRDDPICCWWCHALESGGHCPCWARIEDCMTQSDGNTDTLRGIYPLVINWPWRKFFNFSDSHFLQYCGSNAVL